MKPYDITERLRTPEEMAEYLIACYEEGGNELLRHGVKDVVAAAARSTYIYDPVTGAISQQIGREGVLKARYDGFVAGFICAGGDAEEAKAQAPQFQSCVDAIGNNPKKS